MLKLTRLLILVAVALLATRPIMACCLTGHAEAIAEHSPAETPPCHGEPQKSSQSPTDCPGCLDCDTAVMQAQSLECGALLTQFSHEIPLTASSPHFSGFEHKNTVFITGPPGDPPGPQPTPITLKQRLLI